MEDTCGFRWAGRVTAGIYFHILKVILMIVRVGFVKIYASNQTNYKLALKPRAKDATQSHCTGLGNKTSPSPQDSVQQCDANYCNYCVTKMCTQTVRQIWILFIVLC